MAENGTHPNKSSNKSSIAAADRRAQMDLQVSILAEQELTMLLRMQQKLCENFGVEIESVKTEARRLMDETDVERMVSELEEKLPNK